MPYEKVGDNEPVCIADEVPFEIPESWKWCRLKDVCNIINGFTPLKTESIYWHNGDIPWFTVEDIRDQGHRIKSTKQKITKHALSKNSNRILPKNTVLLCCTASVGEYAITEIETTTNQQFNGLVIKDEYKNYYNTEFLYLLVQSFKDRLVNVAGKTTFNFISVKKLGDFLIPLLSIQEQERIIDKYYEFPNYIDKYNSLENELNKLNEEFPEKLKKSILQQAIQGKLVEQDANDEPASVLLEKIRKEKEKLIKEGKIKKDKNESVIYKRDNSYYEKLNGVEKCIDDEIPFDIPETWEWCRFNTIVNYHMGKTPPRKDSKYWDNAKHNWISISDMIPNGIILRTKEKVNDYSVDKIFKNQISKKGTLIMSFKLTVGRVSILDIDAYHNEAIISIYPYINTNNIITNYLFTFLPLLTTFGDSKTAIKGKTLNSSSINSLLVPLPSIMEQKNIINKINQLFVCIDKRSIYK